MKAHVNTTTDSVRIVLFDISAKNKFLLLSEKDDPQNVKLPGGKFNSVNEPPLEAARREISEELGISSKKIKLIEAAELVNDDGKSKRFIFMGFCNANSIKPSDEIDHIQWSTKDNIPDGVNHNHIVSALRVCTAKTE